MKWHVVADQDGTQDPDEEVWTLSRDPEKPGWNTDSGYPGYGLRKADAEELAGAANAVAEMFAGDAERLRIIGTAENSILRDLPLKEAPEGPLAMPLSRQKKGEVA